MPGTSIDLPSVRESRGTLTHLTVPTQVPFPVQRIFFLHDLPPDTVRGRHAHRTLHEFVLCLSGSAELLLDDGRTTSVWPLVAAENGVHIPPLHWITLRNFSPDVTVVVLASAPYDEADYIRDYATFRRLAGASA